jgi:hypothetical protein
MKLQEQITRMKSIMGTLKEEVSEEIDAEEAYSGRGSIKTVADGKRDIAFLELNPILSAMIMFYGLEKIKVPNSENYIVYRKGVEDKVKELLDIASRYGGYLRYDASEEDSRRIGQLLGYKESDIENYIKHNKSNINPEDNN